MERSLDLLMDDILNKPGVFGVVFADHQGLCLGAKGSASTRSAGVISALADQAAKLEPGKSTPVICYEGMNKMCVIQRSGTITGGIYRNKTS